MCRITGFWDFSFKGSYEITEIITEMRDALIHGGPDDAGLYVDNKHSLALGHRRLSVLDLSNLGHQPMPNEDESLWITYNGEVYNFFEIREDIKRKGYKFRSRTDTEVILKAWEERGVDAVQKFRGMFAFAIWDKRKEKLYLVRDRIGVKPLYYYFKNGLFMFSSELKAFHKHPGFFKELDKMALANFLQNGYISAPHAIFKNTFKLLPGHYLEIDKNGIVRVFKYWDVENYFFEGLELKKNGYWSKKNEIEILDELEELLTESFRLRLVSDVPVGVFLSGGIDSSIVTALLQKHHSQPLKTFTIGFYEKKFNEAAYANEVARHLGSNHTEVYCTPNEAFNIIPKLPEIYDEPFGDSSAIPTYLVSKITRERVKVALSADGGDELFCGYPQYWLINKIRGIHAFGGLPYFLINRGSDLISPNIISRIYNVFKPFLPKFDSVADKYIKLKCVLKEKDIEKQRILLGTTFFESELKELGLDNGHPNLTDYDYKKYNSLNYMMLADLKGWLPDDGLVKVDRASMAVSLEAREPMLDHKLMEYVIKLPDEFKYRGSISKWALKKILYKYIHKNIMERPKHGFSVPIHDWFKRELKDFYLSYLNKDRIKSEGVFNPAYVDNLLINYFNGKGVKTNKLWYLLVFEMWCEKWMK